MESNMKRCSWTGNDPLLIEYHDTEWGVPVYDDHKQFEFLSMEVMQCELSWLTVLRKRGIFRIAFNNFDASKVARYTDEEVDAIMKMDGMIHSQRKIRAISGINQRPQCLLIPLSSINQRYIALIEGIS